MDQLVSCWVLIVLNSFRSRSIAQRSPDSLLQSFEASSNYNTCCWQLPIAMVTNQGTGCWYLSVPAVKTHNDVEHFIWLLWGFQNGWA